MALRDLFKVSRKTFFNPTAWFGYESLSNMTAAVVEILRTTFSTPKPLREESFEHALKRLGITETDVNRIAQTYRIYALLFCLLAVVVLLYSFYLLFRHGTFIGWMLSIAAAALFGSQAFKYDFWALQMRSRKLGLSFNDWKKNLFGGKGKSA